MKIPLLIAQYLYKHRSLSLPGIGKLEFEGVYDEEKPAPAGSIHFVAENVQSYDEGLVDFIRIHSNKMRSVIHSDLDAFVMEIKEFTNIGNPWYLEGIGTFGKNRTGGFEFTQGTPIAQKLEDFRTKQQEVRHTSPDKYYVDNTARSTVRTVLVVLLVIGGIGGICWGGYELYTQFAARQQQAPDLNSEVVSVDTNMSSDTNKDSSAQPVQPDTQPILLTSGQLNTADLKKYKFVLRRGNKEVIEKRYLQLKSFNKPVIMEATSRSGEFIVYLPLDVAAKDTLRIKDSLRIHYDDHIEIIP